MREALGLWTLHVGPALVSIAARLPASAIAINRAVGIGLDRAAAPEDAAAIVDAYRAAGVARYFIQVAPHTAPAAVGAWLEAAGLRKARAWQKFERGAEPVADRRTDLEIRLVGPEHGSAFAEIVCAAFDLGDGAIPWLQRIPGRPGWHVYMSFDRGRPAGVGTMYVRNGCAWLDFGATRPEYRGRGSQGAIVAQRVGLALALGCRRIYTCTGVEVPGDPQHSYKNILRAGFRETYVRENYAPPND
ncbi:MAG TPA: GNAT family N-acetyltransferase [Burkholderiales bacterium]